MMRVPCWSEVQLLNAIRAHARTKACSDKASIHRQLAEGSSDDEDHFRRKEQRRLARDRANLRPIVLGKFSGLQPIQEAL